MIRRPGSPSRSLRYRLMVHECATDIDLSVVDITTDKVYI